MGTGVGTAVVGTADGAAVVGVAVGRAVVGVAVGAAVVGAGETVGRCVGRCQWLAWLVGAVVGKCASVAAPDDAAAAAALRVKAAQGPILGRPGGGLPLARRFAGEPPYARGVFAGGRTGQGRAQECVQF